MKGKLPKCISEEKMKFIEENVGILNIDEIAEKINVSRASVKRAGNFKGISFRIYKYSEELKKQVIRHYEENGIGSTRETFHGVCIRSIVERSPRNYARQIRWQDAQLIMAVKFAGLLSFNAQAKYFNRPQAFEGSIKSLWMKKFRVAPSKMHGLAEYKAKQIVTKQCPYVSIKCGEFVRKYYLWVDIYKHLHPHSPPYLVNAIHTAVMFQEWIWNGGDVRRKVTNMLKKFEI